MMPTRFRWNVPPFVFQRGERWMTCLFFAPWRLFCIATVRHDLQTDPRARLHRHRLRLLAARAGAPGRADSCRRLASGRCRASDERMKMQNSFKRPLITHECSHSRTCSCHRPPREPTRPLRRPQRLCKRALPKEPTLAECGRGAGDCERRRMKGSKARPGGGDDEGRSGEGATK